VADDVHGGAGEVVVADIGNRSVEGVCHHEHYCPLHSVGTEPGLTCSGAGE
jgi:hypothetical protein